MRNLHTADLDARLQQVRNAISCAEQRYRRWPGSVALLAVSKQQSIERIRCIVGCGQRAFGENHLQEAGGKIAALADLDIEWHFIGPIQSNKTRPIAELFAWVHSIDRLKVARRLSEQRPANLPRLQVCLQVNIGGEISKSGVATAQLPELARQVEMLPRLTLRGLMGIPPPSGNFDTQRRHFAVLRKAYDDLKRRGHALDILSMGMSADMEAAITEGATLVRIGTAIFGPRATNPKLTSFPPAASPSQSRV